MPLDRVPTEILFTIVRDCEILQKGDVFSLILTCKSFHQNLRQFLFRDLSYGCVPDSEDDELLGLLDLHGFTDLQKCSGRSDLKADPHRSLLSAVQNNWITPDDLKKVRQIRLYSDIESLQDDEFSIITFLELLQVELLDGVVNIRLYLLRGSRSPNISARSSKYISRVFALLQRIPVSRIALHLITDTFECLQLVSESQNLTLDTLFIDAALSNREEIDHWQEGVKQFTALTHLAYKGFSPWAVQGEDFEVHGLCDDFPNLKIIRLICSPNFTALPSSVHELYIDIGERDQIIHHCFPLITTLPHLKVLYALNRQNALPRFHFNPMQTVRLPGTAFTGLKTLHAEMPRPDEKLMFFPPGVLETITNCNPYLENVFLPFISAVDMCQLAKSDCARTLRSLEIQSSICRTISRETSFDVSNLISLVTECGLPNLEVLKWSCGGKQELALNHELVDALYPRDPPPARRHNLKLIALESRLPKPQSTNVMAGLLNWQELLDHRQALKMACVNESSHPPEPVVDMEHCLQALLKHIYLTVDGVHEVDVEENFEFPYENPAAVVVQHQELTEREKNYLVKWRKSGGSLGMTEQGHVYDFRKALWEELWFFDLVKMSSFLK